MEFSKSLGKQKQGAGSGAPARQQSSAPMLNFDKSLPGILAEREAQAGAEAAKIVKPDATKGRLRFPSLGDPPLPKPQRSQFKTQEHFQAQLEHWEAEQAREAKVYQRALRSLGADVPSEPAKPVRYSSSRAPRRFAGSK